MTRLAANLSFLFHELPFLDRFRAAKQAGFAAVEFTFVYDMPPGAIAQQCRANHIPPVLMNAPPGNLALGEAGLAALPGREAEMRESFLQAVQYASLIGVPCIHLLAGNAPPGADHDALGDTFVHNLRWAGKMASDKGLIVTIEPLNARDRPDYILRTSAQAVSILERVALPNVRLQLDLYHHALTEGDPRANLRALMPWIAHVQIAGVPDRNEPDPDTLDYEAILGALDRAGYDGYVGCEYLPLTDTLSGLSWADRYLRAAHLVD
jgi:hydroxypyruvate isomerase